MQNFNQAILKFFSGKAENKAIVSPLFGINHLLGLISCFLLIATLFIFRHFYTKVSKFKVFAYFLSVTEIVFYILFFLIHQLHNDIKWQDYFPFQLSSLLNITVSILLIFPNEKLFNITFPLIGPVILAFIMPDLEKRYYGVDRFFYYQYYINHLIILFGYFYLYFYMGLEYKKFYLKKSIFYLAIFSFIVFLFNISFKTNYMFIGELGYSIAIGKLMIDTGQWLPIARFTLMFAIGLIFLISFHYLIIKVLKPFYLDNEKKIKIDQKNHNFQFLLDQNLTEITTFSENVAEIDKKEVNS